MSFVLLSVENALYYAPRLRRPSKIRKTTGESSNVQFFQRLILIELFYADYVVNFTEA